MEEEDKALIERVDAINPIGIEDAPEDEPDEVVGTLASLIQRKFRLSKDKRDYDERRWLKAYRNFRGIYSPDMQFTSTEKSKVFVKITKAKVLASYNHVCEIVFGDPSYPVRVAPTPKPEGIEENVHFAVKDPNTGELPELEPGETHKNFLQRIGNLGKKLAPVKDRLRPGVGTAPNTITLSPAEMAAQKANRKMQDAFVECDLRRHTRATIFELCLLGHGMLKGPMLYNKEFPKWTEEGVYEPETKRLPKFEHLSIWDFYPDPDSTCLEDSEFGIQRHKLSRSDLRNLSKRPYFRKNVIEGLILDGPNYVPEDWEHTLEDNHVATQVDRFEVLEFWGVVDKDDLEDEDFTLPPEFKDEQEVNINCWISGDEVLRLVVNPYKPAFLPFYSVPYEENPYSFFGIGVAENMEDTQLLMNGFMRLAVDNAVLAGNLIIEVSEEHLTPGQDLEVYPGKVFIRQSGAPGQAIFGTNFPNTANENLQLFDKARQLSDEQTGIPSFSHGQTGVTGVGRTSSGISMLLGAASGAIKNVVKNLDDKLFTPLGKHTYSFLMQFDFDPEIRGDLTIKAQGTDAFTTSEVRSQRLLQFLQTTQGDPFAKRENIIREFAKTLDLDPDQVTNNPADAAIYAEILSGLQQQMKPPEGEGVPGPDDTSGTGQGNIGAGVSPTPGEKGFTGGPPQPQAPNQQPNAMG